VSDFDPVLDDHCSLLHVLVLQNGVGYQIGQIGGEG